MRVRILAAALLFVALRVFALDVPPPPNAPFTDTAGLVSASDADALNNKLRAFETETGAQFIVYIFPTIGDEVIEDFTIRCAERWKAGQAKADNGLILFVFVKERKIRFEVGHGLEGTITDAYAGDVIRDVIQPRFREQKYAQGLNDAVDTVIARIKNKEAPIPAAERSTRPREVPSDGGSSGGGMDLGTILFIIFILLFVVAPMFSRRRGGCGGSGCLLPFFMGGGGGSGITFGGGGGGWGGGGGGGGGGWSGGGGSFGGGGATGGW